MVCELEMEVGRIDCRLFDENRSLEHFFILDRVGRDTAMLSGVTFPMRKWIRDKIISYSTAQGFTFLKWQRIGPNGGQNRIVTYNMKTNKFVNLEIIEKD